MRYRINAPHVIAETMAGETTIVHLTTGCYFSLAGSGPEIWDGLVAGETREQVVERLQAAYDASPEELEVAVERLLGELTDEELLVADEDGAAAPAPVAPSNGTREAFAEPSLAKYTDMQDIILLDPVHEVDARGWPHQQAEA